jgi:hypothetical protein
MLRINEKIFCKVKNHLFKMIKINLKNHKKIKWKIFCNVKNLNKMIKINLKSYKKTKRKTF